MLFNIKKYGYFKIFFIFVLVVFVGTTVCFSSSHMSLKVKNANKTISMDFKEASFKSVLKAFSQQSGLNFVASEEVKDTKVTLYFENVRVQDALNRILSASNLTYEYTEGSDIFVVKPTGIEKVKTVTRIYTLNYATVADLDDDDNKKKDKAGIQQIVEKMLSKHGSVMSDKRTNSLIVKDIPAQFPLIERTIAKLDSRTPQVMIEAEVLETSVDLAERFGVGLKSEGSKGRFEAIPFYDADTGDFTTTPGLPTDSTFLGVISYPEFKGILDMLETEEKVKYLARPRILSLNNESAKIDIASWETIGVESHFDDAGNLITTSGERKWVGVKLKVTPHINQEGFITMDILPEVSRTTTSNLVGYTGSFRDIFKKTAESKVMVKDGETVVIGGLTKGEDVKRKRKVPLLGDIPILGWLFKDKSDDDERSELVIFITPHIIKAHDYERASGESSVNKKIMREVSQEKMQVDKTEKPKEKKEIKQEKTKPSKEHSREEEIDWVLDQLSEEE